MTKEQKSTVSLCLTLTLWSLALWAPAAPAAADDDAVSRLVSSLLGTTPLEEDLRLLTDEIGGRPTGTAANLRAVEWARERFREAGVDVVKEPFEMPTLWLERSAAVRVTGDGAAWRRWSGRWRRCAGWGRFDHVDEPVVGTDNFDFMIEGIGNLVANQESANYGPNYHARSDTFDKVDLKQVRLNAAIAAAVVYGFAEMDIDWPRQTRSEIQTLIDSTSLGREMRTFALWESWVSGERGRREE